MLREDEERWRREGVGCVEPGRSRVDDVGVSLIADVDAEDDVEVVETTEEV